MHLLTTYLHASGTLDVNIDGVGSDVHSWLDLSLFLQFTVDMILFYSKYALLTKFYYLLLGYIVDSVQMKTYNSI